MYRSIYWATPFRDSTGKIKYIAKETSFNFSNLQCKVNVYESIG